MEKIITPRSGWLMLFVSLLLLAAAIFCFVLGADENPALNPDAETPAARLDGRHADDRQGAGGARGSAGLRCGGPV